jgi:glutathione-regulated potassium-efflux system ancillary protein KefC
MLLADSEYRHEIETDMAPFKGLLLGLLLGLFFIAVGMSIDFGVLAREPMRVAALVVVLVGIKTVALWLLAGRFEVPARQRTYLRCCCHKAENSRSSCWRHHWRHA